MSFERKKPMATAAANPVNTVSNELAKGLSVLAFVESVHVLQTDRALSVWVALPDGLSESERIKVYAFEDSISERYPSIRFDFHIVSIPQGRKPQEYISIAESIYERSIA
jgi:hypothetical protein